MKKHKLFSISFLGCAALAATPHDPALPALEELESITPGAWTMVLFPDTQYYVDHTRRIPPSPEVFRAMSQWVVDQQEARNIGIVVHVGDIVDNNVPEEWIMAQDCLGPLNGRVPCILATGNHEYTGNARVRETLFNEYFPASRNPLLDPEKGGILVETMEPGRLENAAYAWTAPDGREFLFFALEWGPRHAAVEWANKVTAREEFAGHTAVLTAHAYLYHDNNRLDWEAYGRMQNANPHSYPLARDGDTHDGEELWQKLVRRHASFELVFCGHITGNLAERHYYGDATGTGYLRSVGDAGQDVHQVLFNTQRWGDAGDGWLRLLEFQPDGRTVILKTYSPWLDGRKLKAWRSDPENYFMIRLSPVK
jgi:hypothetical protein